MATSNIFTPGEVCINSAFIVAKNRRINVRDMIVSLIIYENIMSPFITGKMILNDSLSLDDMLPFVGEELLDLDIESPERGGGAFKRSKVFHIYKMESKEDFALKNETYTLNFVSIECLTDMNILLSQTFKGKISGTVNKVFSYLKSEKPIFIESTNNDHIHTSNFWSPTQNIFYLATKGIGQQYNNPNYVFYEDGIGFNFATFDYLTSKEPIQKFHKDSHTRQEKDNEEPDREYQKVLGISIPTFYDYIERHSQGMYGASSYLYDIETKQLHYVVRMAKNDFSKVLLNPEDVISDDLQYSPEGIIRTQVKHWHTYNDSPVLPLDHPLRRMSQIKRNDALTVMIEVFGRVDYTVGKVVFMDTFLNRPLDQETTDIYNRALTGNWLITAITHEITNNKHLCYIELSKDSIKPEGS